jgi:outer membrane receptor for ferrienterochelin and colicins
MPMIQACWLNGIISVFFTVLFTVPVSLQAENKAEDVTDDPPETRETVYPDIESSVNVLLTSIASKKEEKLSDAPGVVSIVTQDELLRFGGTTLSDILNRVPSLLQTTYYLTERSSIVSRGDQISATSTHTLLLINGRPVREILEGGIESEIYESFPVSVIDRIEVIRGPGSVLYGSQAVSAVINVITKQANNNQATVSGVLGEGGSNNVMADLQYQIGNFGVIIAGRYADKGDWETVWKAPGLSGIYTNNVTIPNNGPGVYTELSYSDNKYLNFRYMGSYCQWDTRYFVPDFQYLVDVPGLGVEGVTSTVPLNKLFSDVGYSLEAFKNYRLNANITLSRSWFKMEGTFPMLQRDSYESIGEVTNTFTPVENCNVVVGGVWGYMTGTERNAKIDSVIMNAGRHQQTYCGYAQVDYQFRYCKLIGGLQVNKVADYAVKYPADYNPRAGVIFYPFENIDVKALYSTAYRAPGLNEIYLDHMEMKGKMNGEINPSWPGHEVNDSILDPEKIRTFDVGINYNDEKVNFGLNAYHSNIENLIYQERTEKWVHPTYENIGEVTYFGLECEGKYYLTNSLFFLGSFLYQHSEDEITDETEVTPVPAFSVKGGISYCTSGLTISAFNTYRPALPPKFSNSLNPKADDYHMANVYCSYDLNRIFQLSKVKQLSLVLAVDNLFDEEIWLPDCGLIVGNTIPFNEGRKTYGGFKVTF